MTVLKEDHAVQKVVGYIRVSTRRQGEEGISLDEQAHMLRGYCDDKKLHLLSIQEDDGSAAGAQDHLLRDGYREAIKIAKDEGAIIVVPSVDRLARHPDVLPEIVDNNLQVISVSDGRRLSRRVLRGLIERARRERDLISRRASEGAARAKSRGVKLGNKKNLKVAQRNGAVSNMVRADRKVQELADFMEHTSGWEEMPLREKVDLLNRSGLLNLVSEKRGERQPWTIGSIRKPLKKAEAELDMRKQLDAQDKQGIHGFSLADNQDVVVASSDRNDEGLLEGDLTVPMDVAYEDHPGFGKF
tara:strand:+ start:212 stop:1114 length:903 start_codon:yes stop_codon:yes gene_type:complete